MGVRSVSVSCLLIGVGFIAWGGFGGDAALVSAGVFLYLAGVFLAAEAWASLLRRIDR